MGQMIVKLAEPLQNYKSSVANIFSGRRKRKRDLETCSSADELNNSSPQMAKKKKLLTTTQYIYKALFQEQKNADISVMAIGKVWKLHKVYLCQSPYFYSMFNGSWKESTQEFVHIKILDERITLDALDAVFGSMYSDEIEIDPKAVVSVLATATLFHLEGIIDKCAEVMSETINVETAVDYYDVGCQYGCVNVKKAAFEWLLTNLLCIYSKNPNILRSISVELMTALILSPDLYVMQTEFSLYTLLRSWIYFRLNPNLDCDTVKPSEINAKEQKQKKQKEYPEGQESRAEEQQLSQSQQQTDYSDHPLIVDPSQKYFMNRGGSQSFLATSDGKQFVKAFQALRTQYLTNHQMDLKIVLKDNIIPKDWVHVHVLTHWNAILKVDHLPEEGPQNLEPEEFYKNCMRFGRILLEPGYQKWRWTGFNFGLDLILIADSRVLSIRRHHRNEHERLLSLRAKRQFMIRASVTSINSQRQPIFTQKSEITSLNLEKNEEVMLMVMDTKLVHPLLISVNLLVVAPTSQSFKQHIRSAKVETPKAVPISEFGGSCDRSTSIINRASDAALCIVPPSPPAEESPSASYRSSSASSASSTTSSSASFMDLL